MPSVAPRGGQFLEIEGGELEQSSTVLKATPEFVVPLRILF